MKGSFTGRPRSLDDTAAPESTRAPDMSGDAAASPPDPQSLPKGFPGRIAAVLPSWLRGPYFPDAPLKTRLIIAMISLVVVTAGVVGYIAYRSLEDALLHSEMGRLESDVRAMAINLDASVRDVRDDVIAIRGANGVKGIVRGMEAGHGIDPKTGDKVADWRTRLAAMLEAGMHAKTDYLQMRMIGIADGGREIVRVERSKAGGPIRVVPQSELQQKGNHAYFSEAIRLPKGGVYVSPLNLNREHGAVEVPHTPVLRASTPVYDDSGKIFGVIVINVAMQPLLDKLRAQAREGGRIYLVNDDGDYLVHPDRAHEFGFDLGTRYRLQDEFPSIASLVHAGSGRSRMVKGSDKPAFGVAASTTMLAGGPSVTVLEALPLSILGAPLESLRLSALSTGIAGILLATLLAILIARSLTNPLEEMIDGIAALQQGKPVALPTKVSGEIGTLARAFEDYVGQERLYRSALQSSYDAIFTNSLDGVITSWNPGAERIYGFTAEEAIGQPIRMLVPEDRLDEQRRSMARIRRGEVVGSVDTVRLTKSGRLVEVSVTPSLVRSSSGEPLGVSVIARDISERRLAEKRFKLAVESSPTGMAMVKADGTVVMVNAEVERMFGYDKGELLGRNIDVLVPERFRAGHAGFRHGFSQDPESRAMGAGRDLYASRKDSSEFPIEIGLNPIPQPDELLILASVVDISERKQAQMELEKQKAELERSNADLEQFAYVASHDLQEPLRMVASYTSLLEERYKGQLDERADKYINYAVEGAKRMQQLISDLLDFSRVGTRAKPMERVDTNALLEKVLRSLRGTIADKGAEVTHGTLPAIVADDIQLGMVFQNLIANAVKFRADRPPRVHVDAAFSDGMWTFSVADNGIGIDKQYSSRIFQMFQRLHERGKYDGSGIGLAIVKKIVERHGGTVWFESVPGEGTTFFFTISGGKANQGGAAI